MFRASAQSYSDEISSGLYNEHQILQMSAQAVTWTEAADSLENMYLIDSTPTQVDNFEQDIFDVLVHYQEHISVAEALGAIESLKFDIVVSKNT